MIEYCDARLRDKSRKGTFFRTLWIYTGFPHSSAVWHHRSNIEILYYVARGERQRLPTRVKQKQISYESKSLLLRLTYKIFHNLSFENSAWRRRRSSRPNVVAFSPRVVKYTAVRTFNLQDKISYFRLAIHISKVEISIAMLWNSIFANWWAKVGFVGIDVSQ